MVYNINMYNDIHCLNIAIQHKYMLSMYWYFKYLLHNMFRNNFEFIKKMGNFAITKERVKGYKKCAGSTLEIFKHLFLPYINNMV